jgi:hypothetical protein
MNKLILSTIAVLAPNRLRNAAFRRQGAETSTTRCRLKAAFPVLGFNARTWAGAILTLNLCLRAAGDDSGFVSLFDGRSFAGWKMAAENTNTWRIEDGVMVTRGGRCHLFYVGDDRPFKDFELKADVMTDTNSNGGIYFHTRYQAEGWPKSGFETQVNNTHKDWKKTGSLYDVVNVKESAARDNEWWTQHVIVQGDHVTVKINGRAVMEYTEPAGQQPGAQFTRKLAEGTFALQAHDPGSVVRYKNIRVKRLE